MMTNRIVLAIATGMVGFTLGLLIADTIWALTSPLPTFWRYVAGGVVGIAGGLWIGDATLTLEGYQSG